VGLARLGARVAFIGALSPDPFGVWLRASLEREGVDVSMAPIVPGTQTRMAWVVTTAERERRLAAFSELGCADASLSHVPVDGARFFHFGGVALASPASSDATLEAARNARERGLTVSFDPNWREALWKGRADALETLRVGAYLARILKVSRDELDLLFPGEPPHQVRRRLGLELLAITDGPRGARWLTAAATGSSPSPRVEVTDTTGAGDAFVAALLWGWSQRRPAAEVVALACRAGALACTRVGAWEALPRADELERV
jgi:fructokinase